MQEENSVQEKNSTPEEIEQDRQLKTARYESIEIEEVNVHQEDLLVAVEKEKKAVNQRIRNTASTVLGLTMVIVLVSVGYTATTETIKVTILLGLIGLLILQLQSFTKYHQKGKALTNLKGVNQTSGLVLGLVKAYDKNVIEKESICVKVNGTYLPITVLPTVETKGYEHFIEVTDTETKETGYILYEETHL